MSTQNSRLSEARLVNAERSLRAAIQVWNHPGETLRRPRTFVTVSRQPGAGGISFSHQLAQRLNDEGEGDWSAWDRELVEKVSAEHGIAKEIIETIPSRPHNWLDDFLQSFTVSPNSPDLVDRRAYKRVVMTIRALATAGHAVIVGRGGSFITDGLPGAIHLRLVAPLEYRVKHTAERDGISVMEAARRIVETDRLRTEFYHHYWPSKVISPETMTMTLNCAELSVEELVDCVVPLIRARESNRPA